MSLKPWCIKRFVHSTIPMVSNDVKDQQWLHWQHNKSKHIFSAICYETRRWKLVVDCVEEHMPIF